MKKKLLTDEVAAILAQAQSPEPPPDWKIHVIPRLPIFISIVLVGCIATIVFFILLALIAVFLGLFVSEFLTYLGEKIFLPIAALILVYIIWHFIRERSQHALVIITTNQVIVYDPVSYFRRVHMLGFAEVQGMELKRMDNKDPDTGNWSTSYYLELQYTSGKQGRWSLNSRYNYPPNEYLPVPIYKEIIAQFERYHLS